MEGKIDLVKAILHFWEKKITLEEKEVLKTYQVIFIKSPKSGSVLCWSKKIVIKGTLKTSIFFILPNITLWADNSHFFFQLLRGSDHLLLRMKGYLLLRYSSKIDLKKSFFFHVQSFRKKSIE